MLSRNTLLNTFTYLSFVQQKNNKLLFILLVQYNMTWGHSVATPTRADVVINRPFYETLGQLNFLCVVYLITFTLHIKYKSIFEKKTDQ